MSLSKILLASVSHEYWTPLNAIKSCADHLKHFLSQNKENQRYIDIILINVELLLSLIDDILDNSKIEWNMLNLSIQEFWLKNLFEEIKSIFEI